MSTAVQVWLFLVVLASVIFTSLTYREIRKVIVMVSKNQEKIDKFADQLDKAQTEIVNGIAELEAKVEAGETLDFSRLKSVAQELDDLHEDAPVVDEGDGDVDPVDPEDDPDKDEDGHTPVVGEDEVDPGFNHPGNQDEGDVENPDPGFTHPEA